jgi:hypothetical protein
MRVRRPGMYPTPGRTFRGTGAIPGVSAGAGHSSDTRWLSVLLKELVKRQVLACLRSPLRSACLPASVARLLV